MLKKYVKNVLFWLIFLPIFYALCGFVILPWWVRTQLPSTLQKELNLTVSMEQVRFNPFTFELDINAFSLLDPTANKVVTVDHLYLNYEPSSLFKKEFFVKTLLLDKPFIDMTIDTQGSLKLLQLFAYKSTTPDQNTTSKDDLTIPFAIEHAEIDNARISFKDERSSTPFALDIGPINYSVNNLSFFKDDLSIHALKIALQNEDKISLATSATIEPLKFYGELKVNQLALSSFWKYLLPTMPATLAQGDFSLTLPFLLDLGKEKPLFTIENATASLENVRFEDAQKKTVINIPLVKTEAINFDLQDSSINIKEATLLKPDVYLALEKGYSTNLEQLFQLPNETNSTKHANTTNTEPATLWKFSLKRLLVDTAQIHIDDHNVKAAPMILSPLSVTVSNITNDATKSIAFDLNSTLDKTASLALTGTFIPKSATLNMDIRTKALSFEKAQPYIKPFTTILIQDGALSSSLALQASFAKQLALNIKGTANISKFSLGDKDHKSLVAWETLNIDNFAYNLSPAKLAIQNVTLDKPYINLDIKKDSSTNFTGLMKTTTPSTKSTKKVATHTKQTKANDTMDIYIKHIAFKRGTAHFQDASLLLPFATFADKLNGSISTLDSKSTKPSVLKLEGKVAKYGYAKVDGSLLPLDFKNKANVKILFKNIDMPSLTPYSGKFVGYAIKEGKLSMDLNYKIKKGLMEGSNKINLDSLTLGEKIESKDAVNLPLDLAIALLKDSKGQIDIDLPVSGDLNDPDFRYGSIVWKAIGNLITGIVTSPFKLLGSILGIETENLKSIDFAAGESALIGSEEEKMVQYQQILEKRDALKLHITPSYSEAIDTQALRENNITAQIEQMIPKKSKEDDSYSRAIKKLFIQKYSSDAYNKLIKTYEEEKLDAAAINDNLIAEIAKTVIIEPASLEQLAQKRADTIIQNLSTKYHIAPERLIKDELKPSDAIREEWVGCTISVSN